MKSIHGGDIYNNKVNMDFSVNINPLGIPHSVKEAMSDLMYIPFRFEDGGTRVIHYSPEEYEEVK